MQLVIFVRPKKKKLNYMQLNAINWVKRHENAIFNSNKKHKLKFIYINYVLVVVVGHNMGTRNAAQSLRAINLKSRTLNKLNV